MQVPMNTFLRKIALMVLALSPLPTPISADELDDILQVTLRPGWRATDGTHIAALQITLAPGWKTYWRQPGDTGIPPKFDFTQSSDLDLVDVLYPTPQITWQDQIRTIGYQGSVVFPIVTQPRITGDVTLMGQIEVGVCEEICIPVSLDLSARLPARGPTDPVIVAALKTLPRTGKNKIICTFSTADEGMQLSLSLPHPDQEISDATIELGNSRLWIETPTAMRAGDQLHISANILTPSGNPVAVGRGDVITTIFSATSATEYIGCQGS
jgi:DsbC/DsbD-like thiol-disulfide interchange protein